MGKVIKPQNKEKDSNGIKPIVEIGAKAIGGLFSSLIDEQLASAERDIAEIISQQKLGAKAQSRRRDFTANIERKRSDAREAKAHALESIQNAEESLASKKAKWGDVCSTARAKLAEFETSVKRDSDAIRGKAAEEMAKMQKTFGREVDRVLGL